MVQNFLIVLFVDIPMNLFEYSLYPSMLFSIDLSDFFGNLINMEICFPIILNLAIILSNNKVTNYGGGFMVLFISLHCCELPLKFLNCFTEFN